MTKSLSDHSLAFTLRQSQRSFSLSLMLYEGMKDAVTTPRTGAFCRGLARVDWLLLQGYSYGLLSHRWGEAQRLVWWRELLSEQEEHKGELWWALRPVDREVKRFAIKQTLQVNLGWFCRLLSTNIYITCAGVNSSNIISIHNLHLKG